MATAVIKLNKNENLSVRMIQVLTQYLKYDKNLSFKYEQRINQGTENLMDF